MGATNYVTATMNENFEQICALTLLEHYCIHSGVSEAGILTEDTISVYNGLMTSGKGGQALMVQITSFFEHDSEECLEKLMKLYGILRENLK